MADYLKFRFEVEDDSTGELLVEFHSDECSGRGHAYFDAVQLSEAALRFADYPLNPENQPCIEGGYYGKNVYEGLTEEHLHISAYPVDGRGTLGLRVRVAEPSHLENRPEFRYSASMEFIVNYQDMTKLSLGLSTLARGECKTFTLMITP